MKKSYYVWVRALHQEDTARILVTAQGNYRDEQVTFYTTPEDAPQFNRRLLVTIEDSDQT